MDLSRFHWTMISDVVCAACGALFYSFSISPLCFQRLILRARAVDARRRFFLVDVFALMVTLQVAAGIVFFLSPALESYPLGPFRLESLVFVWIVSTAWWFSSVRLLSRARIESWWERFSFLVFWTPVGFSAPLLAVAAGVTLLVLLVTFAVNAPREVVTLQFILASCVTLAVSSGASVATRRYANRLAKMAGADASPTTRRERAETEE